MFKTLKLNSFRNTIGTNKRSLWQWIKNNFNGQSCERDDDLIKEIGPNMACAEWLVKNGAQVRWKGSKEFVSHYDCLPFVSCECLKQFEIQEVYAGKEASISHDNFCNFKNCDSISQMAFVGCHTINNQALFNLEILKDSLTRLEINGCVNVSLEGILALEHLKELRHLHLKNLNLLYHPDEIHQITCKLRGCNIIIHDNYDTN